MKHILTAAVWLVCSPIMAQATWTMDQCIAYALEHSTGLQQQRLALHSAEADRMQAAAGFLPYVSGSIGGQFSLGRGIDPETNTYTTVTNFSSAAGVQASWIVFDGGRTVYQWRQAVLARRKAAGSLQWARDSKAIEVMHAYINACYAQGCRELAATRLSEAEHELRKARLQEETGIKSRPDVALIEAQKADAEYVLTRQEGEESRTKGVLALAMNAETQCLSAAKQTQDESGSGALASCLPDPSSGFRLVVDSEELAKGLDVLVAKAEGQGLEAGMLPAFINASLDVEHARLQQRISRTYMMPSLSLSAGISTGYYRTLTGGYASRPLKEQVRDNLGKYVSATISFPVFGNLGRIASLKKARYSLLSAQLQRDETLRQLEHDALQAVADCRQGVKEVAALARKMEADSLAYSLCLRKFEEGLLTAQELISASRELQDTRISLLQARLTLVLRERLARYYQTGKIISQTNSVSSLG